MRQIQPRQLQLGETLIESIRFDLRSRDDIPQILRGLQHIYSDPVSREVVFAHLKKLIPEDVDANNGRPGMYLWNVFVLASLRTNASTSSAQDSAQVSIATTTASSNLC